MGKIFFKRCNNLKILQFGWTSFRRVHYFGRGNISEDFLVGQALVWLSRQGCHLPQYNTVWPVCVTYDINIFNKVLTKTAILTYIYIIRIHTDAKEKCSFGSSMWFIK
jgi:hypothetical protein